MGKLVGGACVLIGFVILLACWMERMKRNIRNMLAIVRFLQSWAYVLEVRQMRVAEFLEAYSYDVPELEHVADEVQHDLLLHLYPTGQEVWQKVLKRQKHTLGLPEDAFQVLLRAGEGFFGNNHRQTQQCITSCIRQMETVIGEEREHYLEKRKVYMPVGMLTGVMVVILLL